jgi:hypothetical protein
LSAASTESVELHAPISVAAVNVAKCFLVLARHATHAPDTLPGLDADAGMQHQLQQPLSCSPLPVSTPPSIVKIATSARVHELSWDVPPKRRKEPGAGAGAGDKHSPFLAPTR